MKVYGGIYLQSGSCQVVFVDDQSQVVFRKQLPNEMPLVLEEFNPFKRKLEALAVASTDKGNSIVSGLIDEGYRLYLFHRPTYDNSSKNNTKGETPADLLANTMRNILRRSEPETTENQRITSIAYRKFFELLA